MNLKKDIAFINRNLSDDVSKTTFMVYRSNFFQQDYKLHCALLECLYRQLFPQTKTSNLKDVINAFSLEIIDKNKLDSTNKVAFFYKPDQDILDLLLRVYFNFLDTNKTFFGLSDILSVKLQTVLNFESILDALDEKINFDYYNRQSLEFIQEKKN